MTSSRVLPSDVSDREPPHVSLLYDVWAPVDANTGTVPEKGTGKARSPRDSWFDTLTRVTIDPGYTRAFERWKRSFSQDGDRLAELTLTSRLLVGHGNNSATDVGLTVHHTWGVPYIPGSALKGLLAHYIDATYGPSESERPPWELEGEDRVRAAYRGPTWKGSRILRGPGELFRRIFGAPEATEDETMRAHGLPAGATAGEVRFHDALYVPGSATSDRPYVADVLTVHQKNYYSNAGGRAPNDYDSPNPVSFLTVRPKSRFLLALSGPGELTDLASALLADALAHWGVGGKTAAGYGFGTVSPWKAPEPRRSKLDQALFELQKHAKDELRSDIEKWLLGEPVTGALRAWLTSSPSATTGLPLEIVRVLGERLELRAAWASRLKNKKADERKIARAKTLLAQWDTLVTKERSS